jgi:Ca-activated chloride channel family protein
MGKKEGQTVMIDLPEKNPDFFQNTGIRKAILLARYANIMLSWMLDEAKSYQEQKPIVMTVSLQNGIPLPDWKLGKWERQSIPLRVSPDYKEIFTVFLDHFKKEMHALGDKTLQTEADILELLINHP